MFKGNITFVSDQNLKVKLEKYVHLLIFHFCTFAPRVRINASQKKSLFYKKKRTTFRDFDQQLAKIKSVRGRKHSWISIHRSSWKTLMCKLPSPKVNIHDDVSIRHVSCYSPPHPSLSSNVSLQFSFWNSGQSWLPRLFQIILKISFSTKFLLTWAACITSHCVWWHLQSKTLTFRQLENSASQLYQRHLLWFHIHFFIYIFDNRPF